MIERRPSTHARFDTVVEFAGKAVCGLFMISPPLLAWFGYQQGSITEQHANRATAEEVVQLKNCLSFLSRNAPKYTIPLSVLPPSIEEACQLPKAIVSSSSTYTVEPRDVTVNLPQPGDIKDKIDSAQADANDFNTRVPLEYAAIFGGIGCGYALYGLLSSEG